MATSPYRNSSIEGKSNPGNRRVNPLRSKPQVSTIKDRPTQDLSLGASLDNVIIFEKSTIKLDRQIFSKESFNKKIDTSFEELQSKEETFSPKQFFELYNSLFFNLPKLGTTSHAQLISRSREYLKGFNIADPKDERINNLLNQISKLEQSLLQADQADPEHPFFRNGTIVSKKDSTDYFYMDKGFKRQINYTDDFHDLLLKILGYNKDDHPNGDRWYPAATSGILSSIKTGPNLSEGNFEQGSYIENGELYVGVNITDNTKDAEINRLRNRISEIEGGDFSSLPELDAISIDISEIEGIANKVADDARAFFNQLLDPLPGVIKNSDKVKELRDKVVNKIRDKVNSVLQSFLNFANTQG
tara:strand:- start:4359 stop:5435 length:1077 start_codon:yes stop_codon:yes gene_type:complete